MNLIGTFQKLVSLSAKKIDVTPLTTKLPKI